MLDCYLDQHVHEPTRMKNILDLVLTNDLQLKDDVRITAPVGNSDHNVLIWETESIKNNARSCKTRLCFNQADYNNMRLFVQHKLSKSDSSSMGASTMWSTFRDILHETIDKYVPRTQINNKRKKLVPWGTDGRLPLSDLDFDFVHHSSTSTYVSNFIEIGRKFFFESHH